MAPKVSVLKTRQNIEQEQSQQPASVYRRPVTLHPALPLPFAASVHRYASEGMDSDPPQLFTFLRPGLSIHLCLGACKGSS